MKVLNVVRSKNSVSDVITDDPITQTGQDNVKIFNEENLPTDFFVYFIKLGDKHCTGYTYGDAFVKEKGVLSETPIEIMKRIKKGTAKIVLSWPLESFVEDNIFFAIHNYFNHYQISLTSIVYLNCCSNGKILYDSFCSRNEIGKNLISLEYIPWYLYDTYHVTPPYIPGKRNKTFFALNRRMHEHRCLTVMLMTKENLLDKFYMSFPKNHIGTNETFLYKASGYIHSFSRYGLTLEDVKRTDEKLPLILDVDNWNPYPLPIVSNKLKKFYDDSFMSLVAETYFFSNVIHLTEKTFKPIINHHPFIMVSSPRTLQAIKSFGFKTFDNIIDESYDTIEDHYDRFNAILSIIRHLATWDSKKLENASREIKQVVDYNYLLLNSRPRVELNNFIEKYGVEK